MAASARLPYMEAASARLPYAAAVVHPGLPGSAYPFAGLCGAAVAFKLAWAIATRASGSKLVTPRLRAMLLRAVGLATLGTVADVMPLVDAKDETKPETNEAVTNFIAFVKKALGDAVSDVRASDRLTDSAVCLVASEQGPDRSLEKLLHGAGRVTALTKPILEINPRHEMVIALAGLGDGENEFKEDAAHFLYDEALVLDGERPADHAGELAEAPRGKRFDGLPSPGVPDLDSRCVHRDAAFDLSRCHAV